MNASKYFSRKYFAPKYFSVRPIVIVIHIDYWWDTVEAEDRHLMVAAEIRYVVVPARGEVAQVTAELRESLIGTEDRTVVVPNEYRMENTE